MSSMDELAAFRIAFDDCVRTPMRNGQLSGPEADRRLDRAEARLGDILDAMIAEIEGRSYLDGYNTGAYGDG